MRNLKEMAESATNILIPKGDDNKPSIQAFQEWADIEVPSFRGRELMAKSGGRVFWLFKGKDIPNLIATGKADIGMTGTDSRIEYTYGTSSSETKIRYGRIAEAMCRFSLLALDEQSDTIRRQLEETRSMQTLQVVTSRPRLLDYYSGSLPIIPTNLSVNGSVEAALRLVGTPLAADIVQSGETARQNGLKEILTLGLMYPEVVARGDYEDVS
jgi:ATP phosphoribosyltransferase